MEKSKHFLVKMIFAFLLVLGAAIFTLPSADVMAAKMTNKKAQTLLKKKIKNKVCRYAFVDLDNDKIEELIVLSYSGKFVDGDDKKKTLNVYKVVGKKVKSIFDYSIDGDFYHPSLTFAVYRDEMGDSYLVLDHEHEGYRYFITYYWNGDYFAEMARVEESDGEAEYRVRLKHCEEDEYFAFMKELLVEDAGLDIKTCSTKVANKYLKKMMKAEFDYLAKFNCFDEFEGDYSIVYDDLDGDGIVEMLVRFGAQGGVVFYNYDNNIDFDYHIGYNTYIMKNGYPVFDIGFVFTDAVLENM